MNEIKKMKIATIVIAAGYSSRMQQFKPLLKVGDQTAVERVLMTHQQAGVDQIILVAGYRAAEIKPYFKEQAVKGIVNESYDAGMYTSIQKGIDQLDDDVAAFFVHPVDIPLIGVATIKALMMAFRPLSQGILYPCFMGERGHPPLIHEKYREAILRNKQDGGLKRFLQSHESDATNLALADEAILMDMDTQADYQGLLDYDGLMAPNLRECYALMDLYQMPQEIRKHSEMVYRVVRNLESRLADKGVKLNSGVLRAAALLHDLLKTEADHAQAAGTLLKQMGYDQVGGLIATHMDIEVKSETAISENEILYLADKLVENDQQIDLSHRKKKMLERHKDNPEVQRKIERRFKNAEIVSKKIKNLEN
jgi:CTP:molybdopterin cytidylyltransferase MocA/HD superfamily phosphodiesterase